LPRGESFAAVARRLRVTPRAAYHWVAIYSRDRAPDALAARDRSGRPRLLAESSRQLLHELLGRSPQEFGYLAARWTVPFLREHLADRTGRSFSDDTIRRELQRLRSTWKRSRYTLDPDPAFGGKKEADSAAHPAGAAP
jgi:transposase